MAAERERLARERAELEALRAQERAEQEARLREQEAAAKARCVCPVLFLPWWLELCLINHGRDDAERDFAEAAAAMDEFINAEAPAAEQADNLAVLLMQMDR
jgi:hypothetical protein